MTYNVVRQQQGLSSEHEDEICYTDMEQGRTSTRLAVLFLHITRAISQTEFGFNREKSASPFMVPVPVFHVPVLSEL